MAEEYIENLPEFAEPRYDLDWGCRVVYINLQQNVGVIKNANTMILPLLVGITDEDIIKFKKMLYDALPDAKRLHTVHHLISNDEWPQRKQGIGMFAITW